MSGKVDSTFVLPLEHAESRLNIDNVDEDDSTPNRKVTCLIGSVSSNAIWHNCRQW